jgi:hypothetical protein
VTRAIEPVSAVGSRAPKVPLLPAALPTTTNASDLTPDERPVVETPAPASPVKVPVQDRAMRVEVIMTEGVQTVTIYDELSGQAVYQAPPEHTRQMLDRAVSRARKVGQGIPSVPPASRR